jgi:serine protease Do
MKKGILFCLFLTAAIGICFGQTSALREYVGMISQTFHPDAVEFLQKLKTDVEKRSSAASRSIDNYLKGDSGTGFVYVADDGGNYILTNYHVISQAVTLTITFEKQDGEQSKFSGLTIVAADEDMDIALLAFAGGQKPFKQGLSFLTRPVEESDDVYTAGFPGLGSAMIWQLGRGMVSNASVRLPLDDGSGKTLGPFIQHTAEVDPGNSGGPLLVQTQGVPAGFAVAGINTRKAWFRQAANYSIPLNQVQSFLDASLKPKTGDERPKLDARLASFIEGLGVNKAVYPHIASYLSNDCTGENADYAISKVLEKAPHATADNILTAVGYSPVDGMSYAVAWTIEDALRTKSGKISIETDSVTRNDKGYAVVFKLNSGTISSEWINEYGIWRIRSFGDFAAGDKDLIKKEKKAKADSAKLRTEPDLQIAAGFAYVLDRGAGFGLDITGRAAWFGYGFKTYIRRDFFQLDAYSGLYIPIKAGKVAFIPYGNIGVGFQVKDKIYTDPYESSVFTKDVDFGLAFQLGLQFTTAAVPGLYLAAGYQYNLFFRSAFASGRDDPASKIKADPSVVFIGLGYSFNL